MATTTKQNLDAVDKDPNKINKTLLNFINALISELKIKGHDFRVFEGYRSKERQDYLYSVKKTTSLKGGQSKHNILPSEAVTLLEYKNNNPLWTGFVDSAEYKKIVNNLLLQYPAITWGGNWTKPNVYQFELSVSKPQTISPPQLIPKPIIPAITPPQKQIKIAKPVIVPTPKPSPVILPKKEEESKPIPLPSSIQPKLIPASIKTEIDNSTIILVGVGMLTYFWLSKDKK